MLRKPLILLFFAILIGVWSFSSVRGDDFIDDVYYWESAETQTLPTVSRRSADGQPSDNATANQVQITYIEDSITQHSDTVVRAIIRR